MMEGLATKILADRRAQDRAAVGEARECGEPGALQLPFVAFAVRREDLAESERTSVAELRNVRAELVAGVNRRRRGNVAKPRVPARQPKKFRAVRLACIEAEQLRDVGIECDQIRIGEQRRVAALDETLAECRNTRSDPKRLERAVEGSDAHDAPSNRGSRCGFAHGLRPGDVPRLSAG